MAKSDYVPALRFRLLTALYDPLMERWRPARRIWQTVLQALDLQPGMRLLELGCGPGFLAEQLLQNCHISHYTLVDFSPHMLELSRERLAGFKDRPFSLILSR